jgi:predicted O-methyltransferase YrrM
MNVRLTTIDTFEKAPEGSFPPEKEPPKYEEAKETIEKQGDISKVEIVKACSWKVADNWDKNIDMLFIDGDHRYQAVRKDFNSWEPHLAKDGYILMHDMNLRGVRKAYEEVLRSSRFLLKEGVGTLAVIKKLR